MDNDKYFNLLKGSDGAKSINQHDGFGDLLGECRVSAKEKVNETIMVFQNINDAAENKRDLETMSRISARIRKIQVDLEDVSRFGFRGIGFADDLRQDDIGYVLDNVDDPLEDWNLKSRVLESKVNELDEPDLERPEKARRRPKRRRPLRPKPDVDEVPEEEPRPDDTIKEEPPKKEPDEVPEIGEPDPDEVPPPPEELREPEQPIEMRKEYLGRSKETHYYFITTEGGGGVVDDFVIADQEGVKKYSAKDKDIEVSEENIAEFLIQAYRDMDIAQIERSIFMKYLYPELIKRAPEEEMVEEPEEEFGKEKEPLAPGEEEEEPPRESKKITDSKLMEGVTDDIVDEIVEYLSEEGEKEVDLAYVEDTVVEWDRQILDDVKAKLTAKGIQVKESKTDEDVSGWRKAAGKAKLKKMAAKKDKAEDKPADEKCNKKVKENLIEMKVVDGIGNEFDVNLAYEDAEGAITINGKEFFVDSPDFVSMFRDETGAISEEGLEELALDALAMMEEDEYQKLVAKNQEGTEGERTTDLPVGAEGGFDPDEEVETKPEHELEVTGGIDEPTDDVDMSKGDIHRQPKYRPKKPEPDQEEVGDYNEGKNQPGVRDGTGPAKGSYQRKIKGDVGKRKQAGEKCPKENKDNENIEGDNEMDKKLSEFTDEQLREELEARKEKIEGIDPKKEDSEDTKIKKLAEDGEVKEEKIDETDVAKGAKALIKLAKEALHDGNYRELMDYSAKLAAIEDVIPEEAEAEAKKEDKAEPEKKDDKEDKAEPAKKEEPEEKPEEELDKTDGTDEKKKPPICSKCGKAHWPFEKCGESEDVDEAKSGKDKEAKAKKEKEAKAKKDKKEKEDKAKKDKKDKEDKAKKAKAKKESKIPVEGTEDITESKGLNLLNELLGIS